MTTGLASVSLTPYEASAWLRNGHAMTIYAWARPRRFPQLPPPDVRQFQVAADTRVQADCYWQPDRASRPVLVAMHGLEGSSASHYMRGMAARALRLGWSAVLLNQRNCGGTEHLTPGLYHSGLTADPLAVMRELTTADGVSAIVVAGYSLGGNLTLKLAGELSDEPTLPIRGAVAVSPAMDLAVCASTIERPLNTPYQWKFVRELRARMRRKARLWPGLFDLAALDGIRTIRQFDEAYTAPYHGFANASDYYFRASALRVVDRIRIPTLVVTADDDPLVPVSQFRTPAIERNPSVTLHLERHGGHCGFISREAADGDLYWAERTAMDFLAAALGR